MMKRRTLLLGSAALLGTAGCSGGGSPSQFRSVYEFTVEGSNSERLFGDLLITNRGEVITKLIDEDNGDTATYVSIADYGKGTQKRLGALPFSPDLYDSRRDQFIYIGNKEIIVLNNDLSLASRIPVSLPEGQGRLADLAIDGDSFLIPPVVQPPLYAQTNPAYQMDRTGQVTREYAIPKEYYTYPYLVRGHDQRLYVGKGTFIGVIDETSGIVTPTELSSERPLVFDSRGYAYGATAYHIRKMDMNTRSNVIEMRMPDDYVYFDSGFGSYKVAIDNQDRLYVPIAPKGRRVLVYTA